MSASFPKCNQAGIEFVISTNEELREESMFLSEEFPIAMYTQNFIHAASDSIPFHWHDELQITWISEASWNTASAETNSNWEAISCAAPEPPAPQLPHHHQRRENPVHQLYPGDFSSSDFKEIHPAHAGQPRLCLFPAVVKASSDTKLKKLQNWKQEPLGYFSVMNFLSQVFEEILKEFEEDTETPDLEEARLFHEMLGFVHANFAQPLSVKDIADSARLNKNRCTALFKKYTNMSPIKYVNEYRLYTAKNMILHTDKSISDISADVGYNQISHFIEQFRLSYGMSPSEIPA